MGLFGDMFGWIMVAGFLIPLVMTGLIIGVIVWTIRRSLPAREDPAVAELKRRYARGEISPAEFEVRMRSLTQER
jgi:putative membrane protein